MKITFFDNVQAASKQVFDTNWETLVKAIKEPTTYNNKQSCPLIKLAEFGESRSDKGSLRHDSNVTKVWGVEGDYDGEKITPESAAMLLQLAGIKGAIYTSPSHTTERPRWRVVAPFDQAHSPEERREYAGRLNAALGGCLASESFALSQTYYFGRINGAHQYKSYIIDGATIDMRPDIEPKYPRITPPKPQPAKQAIIHPDVINELRSALKYISDDDYNDRISVGQSLSSLGDIGFMLFKEWACHDYKHPTLEKWHTFTSERTGYQSIFVRAQQNGWINPKAGHAPNPKAFEWANAKVESVLAPGENPFDKYDIVPHLTEMRKRESADKYILGDFGLAGDIITIYAAPNSGKTLITFKLLCDALDDGRIKKNDVYYINADDSYNGFMAKATIGARHGMRMLVPGQQGFTARKAIELLVETVLTDTAQGKVFVFDTIKKFTDPMDKKQTSDFMAILNGFVGAGGTAILLGHANKNLDMNGKIIHAGTSDINDDSFCTYHINIVPSGKGLRRVVFTNKKLRGNVPQEIVYTYKTGKFDHYQELLDSLVHEGSGDEGEVFTSESEIVKKHDRETDEIIESITKAINNGVTASTMLIDYVAHAESVGKAKVRSILSQHTGSNPESGHLWNYQRGEGATKNYFVLTNI